MVVPLVGVALGVAAKLAAKKFAQEATKKAAIKAAVKAAAKKKALTTPKSAIKVVSPSPAGLRKIANDKAAMITTRAKSGKAASTAAKAKEQSMKMAAEKAKQLELKKMQEFMAKGGRPKPPKTIKNMPRYGVRVINN